MARLRLVRLVGGGGIKRECGLGTATGSPIGRLVLPTGLVGRAERNAWLGGIGVVCRKFSSAIKPPRVDLFDVGKRTWGSNHEGSDLADTNVTGKRRYSRFSL